MARRLRCSDGGYVYHLLNRAVGRATIFAKPGDYTAFEKTLRQAWERTKMRLLSYCLMPNHFSYCLMPNHWHLVVWPQDDGELSLYGQWLTVTHVRRWHAHQHTAGTGPVYQGRFKSFPLQADDHFWTVCRYVERNALRANLVKRAEDWRWSSLWHRCLQTQVPWLHEWPRARPADWLKYVNQAETEAEVDALRRSVHRGVPFGEETWQQQTATALGLESSLRGPGRPRKPDTKI